MNPAEHMQKETEEHADLTHEALFGALAMVQRGWTQGVLVRDGAGKECAPGASRPFAAARSGRWEGLSTGRSFPTLLETTKVLSRRNT